MALILIVDDDISMRRMMVRTLEPTGHTLLEASDGQQGLAMVKTHRPDVVITDILMPEKEGIETIREIVEHAPGTRIIAVSGGGSSHNMMFLDIAKAFGAGTVLAKPFRPAQLLQAVERALADEPVSEDPSEGAA